MIPSSTALARIVVRVPSAFWTVAPTNCPTICTGPGPPPGSTTLHQPVPAFAVVNRHALRPSPTPSDVTGATLVASAAALTVRVAATSAPGVPSARVGRTVTGTAPVPARTGRSIAHVLAFTRRSCTSTPNWVASVRSASSGFCRSRLTSSASVRPIVPTVQPVRPRVAT
jgi:hypothetical protein